MAVVVALPLFPNIARKIEIELQHWKREKQSALPFLLSANSKVELHICTRTGATQKVQKLNENRSAWEDGFRAPLLFCGLGVARTMHPELSSWFFIFPSFWLFLHVTWILFGSLRIIFSRKTARPQFTPKKMKDEFFCTQMAMLIDADGCFTVLTQTLRAINIHENTERSTFSPQTLNLFTTWRREMGERENCIFHHNYLPLPQIHIYLPPRMMVFNSGFQFPLSSCFPVHWNNNNLRRLATKIEHFLAFFMASKEILRIPTITWVSHCFMSWYAVAR